MNPTPYLGFTLFGTFVSGWIMPLFFAVSGIAVYSSLAKRIASQFVRDRFTRLMIPFLFVGLLVVLPVNVISF
jgi:glucan biosynthesis protein C